MNELVRVLLPFKEGMQQIEGENIITSSSICLVVVELVKAMKQLKNANLNHCKKLATALHDLVLKRLLPFLNYVDNRLAFLHDPKFKQKWIENDVEKEALRVLQMHVTSRLGPFQEDCSSSNSTDDDNGSLSKKPKLFDFIVEGSKKKKPKNSGRKVEIYFSEDSCTLIKIISFWKKKSELLILAVLAKEFLGLTATSAPAEKLFSIAKNFYTAKRNLLGTYRYFSRPDVCPV